ncbi:MAG: hypothetical protein GXO66_10075 [Euryarchaeota archaeon]|nr:hypothetical protein [Euryarchaeota archaeon]
MEMRLEFLSRSLPVEDGCCGVEPGEEGSGEEEAVLRALEELTGVRWVNSVSIYEDLRGRRLVVYRFPRNLRRAERLGVSELPALVVEGRTLLEGPASTPELLERLKGVIK